MNQLFPLPFFVFAKTVFKNGGISFKGLRNLPPWLIKTILLEPLRWVELSYSSRVYQHRITQDPVFILGFYRSGTSFLHELLTQDDRFGYHTNFQMVMPDLMLACEKWLSPFMDFICRIFGIHDPVHRTPMSFRFPGEEDGAMTTALNPGGAQWGYFFPRIMMEHFRKYVLFENIKEPEIEAWKQDFFFLIKKISLASQGKQLVLKSPPNTARIKLLLSLFPNAKFIFIHRDPYEVYLSNKQFWKVTNRIYALGESRSVDSRTIILNTYSEMMQRYLREKELIPQGGLIEVAYQDFIQEPLGSLRKIYQTLGLDDLSYCEEKMKQYLEGQKSFVRLKHEVPAHERKMITEQWEPFLKHWNYPLR